MSAHDSRCDLCGLTRFSCKVGDKHMRYSDVNRSITLRLIITTGTLTMMCVCFVLKIPLGREKFGLCTYGTLR